MNIKKDNLIYKASLFVSVIIFVWSLFLKDHFEIFVKNTLHIVTTKFSWFYMLLMILFFIFCIWISSSKFKNVKLGDDNSKPEFSNISWICMLFSAGVGIGLVFWGVSEPLTHYLNPLNMKGGTESAKIFAFKKAFLHWGISAWSCYCFLGLALAYMHFRRKKPLLISSLLIPIIGEDKARGYVGKVIDIFTIFATISGIVTSLGMGTLQINSGLNYLFNVPETKLVQVIIISIITVLFLLSAFTGVKKGIKYLSNLNMILVAAFLMAVMVVGPFSHMVKNLLQGTFYYFTALIGENNNIFVKGSWYNKWTIFYWGWWIAWAPFVSMFIARISKGRTIKEFVLGVLCIPAGFSMIWFAVFGTIGIDAPRDVAIHAVEHVETSLFVILQSYPMATFISVLAVILLFTFFISSADSATYVLAMIASNGDNNPKASKKIILGLVQSLLTIGLLFAGGLNMLQNTAILMAFPFGIIMFLIIISFIKDLYKEEAKFSIKGVVKYFDKEKGYGFITADNGSQVFVHYSQLLKKEKNGFFTKGERVKFNVKLGINGPRAIDVQRV